jgi:uncharacterized protein (DUF2267 family)
MNYDEFTGNVQNRARLASTDEAIKAIRATLETLAERLHGGEAQNLAAQLPEEVGHYLTDSDTSETFDMDEFLERVAKREGVDLPESVHHARAVMTVVQEAVSAGEVADVREQLPDDYAPLFEAGSEGEMDT